MKQEFKIEFVSKDGIVAATEVLKAVVIEEAERRARLQLQKLGMFLAKVLVRASVAAVVTEYNIITYA